MQILRGSFYQRPKNTQTFISNGLNAFMQMCFWSLSISCDITIMSLSGTYKLHAQSKYENFSIGTCPSIHLCVHPSLLNSISSKTLEDSQSKNFLNFWYCGDVVCILHIHIAVNQYVLGRHTMLLSLFVVDESWISGILCMNIGIHTML